MKAVPVGEELRRIRVRMGLSIKPVAAALGFRSYRRLAEYEQGVHVPTERTRQRILDTIHKLDRRTDANKEVTKIMNGICNMMGITLSEIGRRIGANNSQLSRWYNGRSLPGEKQMEMLKSLYAESKRVWAAKDEKEKDFK